MWHIEGIFYIHSVKSVLIQSFSGPYFPAFKLNMERYNISLYSVRMRENTDQRNSAYGADTVFTQWLHSRFNSNYSYSSSSLIVFIYRVRTYINLFHSKEIVISYYNALKIYYATVNNHKAKQIKKIMFSFEWEC